MIRKPTRAEKRRNKQLVVTTLQLHNFFPVAANLTVGAMTVARGIAQYRGSAYFIGLTGAVVVQQIHNFREDRGAKWPDLAVLKCLARKAGVWA